MLPGLEIMNSRVSFAKQKKKDYAFSKRNVKWGGYPPHLTNRKDEWGVISPPNPHKGGGYHPLSGVDIPPGRDFPPTLNSCLLQ